MVLKGTGSFKSSKGCFYSLRDSFFFYVISFFINNLVCESNKHITSAITKALKAAFSGDNTSELRVLLGRRVAASFFTNFARPLSLMPLVKGISDHVLDVISFNF